MTRKEYKKIINDILVSENARELEEHDPNILKFQYDVNKSIMDKLKGMLQ